MAPEAVSTAWSEVPSDSLLRAALDASVDGHSLWAPQVGDGGALRDLRCVYVNPAAARYADTTVGRLVGTTMLGPATQTVDAGFAQAMLDVVATGEPLRQRLRLTTRDGDAAWVDVTAVRLAGGLSISGRDVTSEVRLQAELHMAIAELRRIAATDVLTELPNRRGWYTLLADKFAASAANGSPLSVAIIDLDRFKAYNDRYGHPRGDELLRRIALDWRDLLPDDASLARLGGEEFAAAIPRIPAVDAVRLLERLCTSLPDGQTASGGLTSWDGEEDGSSVLARADTALYQAKRRGRAQVVMALAPATTRSSHGCGR